MAKFYSSIIGKVLEKIPVEKRNCWKNSSQSHETLTERYFNTKERVDEYLRQHPILKILPFFTINLNI